MNTLISIKMNIEGFIKIEISKVDSSHASAIETNSSGFAFNKNRKKERERERERERDKVRRFYKGKIARCFPQSCVLPLRQEAGVKVARKILKSLWRPLVRDNPQKRESAISSRKRVEVHVLNR